MEKNVLQILKNNRINEHALKEDYFFYLAHIYMHLFTIIKQFALAFC